MKKFIITILAAILAGGIVSAQSFPDIPAGHWAGEAVEEIAGLGIVIGFPDGTFRGNEAFTRYQAALVVSRLLAVVEANVEADLGALRAALQNLAGDVATQGARLAAAESAIAGLSDQTAANAARLDALEAALASLDTGIDPAVLRDLQNQIASQRVAIDTAQAQAEAAANRANAAYDLALQALASSDANSDEIAALNQALGLLSQRVDGLGGVGPGPVAPPTDLSGVNDAIARNASDIANIRDFVILLRRDQVALRDRVSALEAANVATSESISDLEGRVTALETNPLGFSGNIALHYRAHRVVGDPFDIDRVYGVNARRGMGNSTFSSGAAELDGDASTSANYQTEVGEVAQDRHDIINRVGDVVATLTLNVSAGNSFDGVGSPRALNSFDAVVLVDVRRGWIENTTSAGNAGDGTYFAGYVFRVREFTTTFEPIGAAPLTFAFGEEVSTSFTGYVFDIEDEEGYVATVSSPDFLAFLNPGLTVAYFSDLGGGYLRGIRGTMAPSLGDAIRLQGGVHFAQEAVNAQDQEDVLGDNVVTTVWGLDGSATLIDLVTLGFEYGTSTTAGTLNGNILWVTADVDGGRIPVLNSLGANYRAVDLGFDGIGNTGDTPFELGQTGFGVEVGLGLFILDVTGFYDSYTEELSGDANTGYGVSVAANLFRAFSLTGFYESAGLGGVGVVDATVNEREVNAGYSLLDGEYETKWGVGLRHDGAAANALVPGLNLRAGYERHSANFSRTLIFAEADYTLNVSIVSLTPYVAWRSDNDADAATPQDYSEIMVGTGLQTQALNIFLRPSLQAAVNYRSANYTRPTTHTSSEFQWSVGVNLAEFLLPYSSLTARVGSWNGTNLTTVTNTRGAGDFATDISAGRAVRDVDNGSTHAVFGYEVVWNYFDLTFAYGAYTSDNSVLGYGSAQAFSIRYRVDF